MVKFIIKDKNKWGDILYQEKEDGKHDPPPDVGIWTIISPSIQIKNLYPNCEIRTYGEHEFLLSTEASKVIPSIEGAGGSAAILTFLVAGKRYFLCTMDGGKTIKNAQQCKEIGYWIFTTYNKIVCTKFKNKTNLFLVELEIEQIRHLLGNRVLNGTEEMIIISANEYDFVLDETKYVVITSSEAINTFPENFDYNVNDKNIKIEWKDHHREALLRLFDKSRFKISYLLDFDVYYRI
jgi:hypothetical protein